jgi:hypothetical protein
MTVVARQHGSAVLTVGWKQALITDPAERARGRPARMSARPRLDVSQC